MSLRGQTVGENGSVNLPSPPTVARSSTDGRVGTALAALVLGGVGIGVTEFVTMGLLPEIAGGIGTTIPQAGHTISAYALGVVVGAPTIAIFGNRLPRRELLVALMVLFAVGNALSAVATSYPLLMLARLVAGIPHGAFFGIGSVVAASLVPREKQASAVAAMFTGLTIANIGGVPAATWVSDSLGWRESFGAIGMLGVLWIVVVLGVLEISLSFDNAVVNHVTCTSVKCCTSSRTLGFAAASFSDMSPGRPLLASHVGSISGSRVISAAMNGFWSPTTTTWPTIGFARIGSSSTAGATFLPPAVTMISFFRPVIFKNPSASNEPMSPVLNQPSSNASCRSSWCGAFTARGH